MRRLFALLLLLVVASCERDTTPTTPTPSTTTTTVPAPTARALLQPVGVMSFNNCTTPPTSTCAFNATLLNNGSGCGYQVRGVTRLFDSTGLQLGAPYPWVLPFSQIVQPAERVPYVANFVPQVQAIVAASYITDLTWVDTPCR